MFSNEGMAPKTQRQDLVFAVKLGLGKGLKSVRGFPHQLSDDDHNASPRRSSPMSNCRSTRSRWAQRHRCERRTNIPDRRSLECREITHGL
jgi:hypothetical protein